MQEGSRGGEKNGESESRSGQKCRGAKASDCDLILQRSLKSFFLHEEDDEDARLVRVQFQDSFAHLCVLAYHTEVTLFSFHFQPTYPRPVLMMDRSR